MKSMLTDEHGRTMQKLRLSITDACNFHCLYCMPGKSPPTRDPLALSPKEYRRIIEPLVSYGINEIRITGGEPLLRREFREIVVELKQIKNVNVTLTTNGSLLTRELNFLQQQGINKINISLDSLDEASFNAMTKRHLSPVLQAIRVAKLMGFQIKVNCVVCRGINDQDLLEFVKFSENENIEVRFLELMKIGPAYGSHSKLFMPATEMESKIRTVFSLNQVEVVPDSTSYVFETLAGGRIGFIASESKPFCGSCSRLRLSHRGELRACLMKFDNFSLKNLSSSEIIEKTNQLLKFKPMNRMDHIVQSMHEIGG